MGNPLKISEVKACDDESDLTNRRTPGLKSLALRNCGGSMAYQSWVLALQMPEGRMRCMVLLSCLARGLSRPRLQDAQAFHPHDSSPILAEETTAPRRCRKMNRTATRSARRPSIHCTKC